MLEMMRFASLHYARLVTFLQDKKRQEPVGGDQLREQVTKKYLNNKWTVGKQAITSAWTSNEQEHEQ